MKTGKIVWDVEIAEFKRATPRPVAPLVVKGKVIVGIAGGEYAIRGFLDAYDPVTGKRVLALLYDSGAGRARQRDVAGRRAERGGGADVADRHLRSRAEPALLGHRQSESGLLRRIRHGRQPLCGITRWRSMPTPAS